MKAVVLALLVVVVIMVSLTSASAENVNFRKANFTTENQNDLWWGRISNYIQIILEKIMLSLRKIGNIVEVFMNYHPPFLHKQEDMVNQPRPSEKAQQSSLDEENEKECAQEQMASQVSTSEEPASIFESSIITKEMQAKEDPRDHEYREPSPAAYQEMTEELVSDLVQIVSNEQPHPQNDTDFDMNDAQADKSDGSEEVEDEEGQSGTADETEDQEGEELNSSTTGTIGATEEIDEDIEDGELEDEDDDEPVVIKIQPTPDVVTITSSKSSKQHSSKSKDKEKDKKKDRHSESLRPRGETTRVDDYFMQLVPNSVSVNNAFVTEILTYEASKATDENLGKAEIREIPESFVHASTEAVEAVVSTDEMKPQETASESSDSQKEEADEDHGHESDDSSKSENRITGTGDSTPVDIQDEYTPTPNESQDSNSRVIPNDNEPVPVEADAIQGQEASGIDSEHAEPEANTTPHPASPEAESNIVQETESSSSAHSNAATDLDEDIGKVTVQGIHDYDSHHHDQENNNNELPMNSVDNLAQSPTPTAEYSTASSTSAISEPEATHSNTISDTVDPSVAELEQKTAEDSAKNNSFVIVVKYLSSTLLSFLPEHLKDTILDVNDALVFTGIILLLIVGLCVPYFFVETFLSSRPLKKKVVDLNKALWKVSAAYECQQDEFEAFKKKAFAYDECLSKIEKLETQLELKKSIDQKQKLEIQHLRDEGKKRAKLESEVNALVQTTMTDLAKVKEERNKYASAAASLKKTLKETTEDLESIQAELNSKTMDLELLVSSKDFTENRVKVSENEIAELNSKLSSEITLRRKTQDQVNELNKARETLQEDLTNLRKITLQYEETVNNLTTEISLKENELYALKDSLGDDSPLVEIAEIKAKLSIAEQETKSLQSRIDSITLENQTLSRNHEEASAALISITAENDEAQNALQVLKANFEEKEKERREIMKSYEEDRYRRETDLNQTIHVLDELADKKLQIETLNAFIDKMRAEMEETKKQHLKDLAKKDNEIQG